MTTMTLNEAVAKYDEHMQAIGGCSDGGCVIVKPKGMHTNGGCKCPRDHMKMQRLAYASINLRKAVEAHLAKSAQVLDERVYAPLPSDADEYDRGHVDGWNACRKAMLSQRGEVEGG